ncbi:hypothetical protein GCM10029976_042770 [Kribbella albertanoniae]|uniref:Conjugal transfer protein TrbL n=1 Tax=Kribbella albertanoniae TaxID=1266829 RepID=A0A4R4P364_9ACTN|nr:hypothetical protein [Kribbella albertanoniae]TDC16405.1 hypothetical protein E1261_39040 [Kribbella albertanoniae]
MSWIECLANPSACVASGAAANAADSMWQSFVNWMARGLTDLTSFVFTAFSESTSPRFDQEWWRSNLDLMIVITLPLLVGMFVFQCLSAAIRREPGRLGQALIGAIIGTVGVPFAVAVVAGLGRVVDQISVGILGGNAATITALKRMVNVTALQAIPTLGGSLIVAVSLGLLAVMGLYLVMLLREVALIAFVVFAPVAMASWTWSATRHWLRRWIEIVAALLFSKIVMAMIFTLGLSAIGNVDAQGSPSIGTFLAGILLFAMAAFAPLATYSFVHWAGDHAGTAAQLVQHGSTGASVLKQRADQAQQFAAHHFGGSSEGGPPPVVGRDSDSPDQQSSDDGKSDFTPSGGPEVVVVETGSSVPNPPPPPPSSDGGSSATAVATSQATVAAGGASQASDAAGSNDSQGGEQR